MKAIPPVFNDCVRLFAIGLGCLTGLATLTAAESPYQSSADFAKYAMKLRQEALVKVQPQVVLPSTSTYGGLYGNGGYPWKRNIVTTTFWVGESAGQNNPVHNSSSSWDINWKSSFGGTDNPDPAARRNFIPISFVPQQNPFYVALPYNDVERGSHKPEAKFVIPWFRRAFREPGMSVCRGRWLAIRKGNRVCFAQWEDCGPFRTDHWQYVFGNELPKWNLNSGAGLDVSPAVRDYLGMNNSDHCDWKFVEFRDVTPGPWARYGDNNPFVQNARRTVERMAEK